MAASAEFSNRLQVRVRWLITATPLFVLVVGSEASSTLDLSFCDSVRAQ